MNIEINEPIESALVGICTDDGYDAYQLSWSKFNPLDDGKFVQ